MRRLPVFAACGAALLALALAIPPAASACPECGEYELQLPPPGKPGGGGSSTGGGSNAGGTGGQDTAPVTPAPAPVTPETGVPEAGVEAPVDGSSAGEGARKDRKQRAKRERDAEPASPARTVAAVSRPLSYEPASSGEAVSGELTRGLMPVLLLGLIAIAVAGAWSRRRRRAGGASADSP